MIGRRMIAKVSASLRYKLLVLVLAPIVVLTPLVIGLATYWFSHYSNEQLYLKVSTDLAVTHDVFRRNQKTYLHQLQQLANSHLFYQSLKRNENEVLRDLVGLHARSAGFDFINLLSVPDASLRVSSSLDAVRSRYSTFLHNTLLEGRSAVGIEVYSRENLKAQSASLAERVHLPLVDTPRAKPTQRTVENRGMMIRALYPVRDADGEVLALLEGGVLLNANFAFVDAIRDLVYGPGSLLAGSRGTVTVFLDDVRINTNVPTQEEKRALGTRVSQEVRDTVLQRGTRWINRAFVVNDWYVSAYEPIRDVSGRRIGILYAGFLETPFRERQFQAISVLAFVLLAGAVLATVIAVWGAKSIFKPVEIMAKVVRNTRVHSHQRIGQLASQDEIGELAHQIDDMLDRLEENQMRIQRSADELELKVQERTSELKEKNLRLQQSIDLLRKTRRQLAMAEKLAALGELTAGVAHEINNPTAVILGNMEVLIQELGEKGESVKVEADLIIEQVYRIRSIVDRLLQYSRPSDYSGQLQTLDVNQVVEDTLLLVRHELSRQYATLNKSLNATRCIDINRQELQQVLVNILVNAAHAIDEGGCIDVSTEDWGSIGVLVRVVDDGQGIDAKDLDRIFDPFYTQGKSDGTGLGLSVSYGLIRRYGGKIQALNRSDGKTVFEIYLRVEPEFVEDEEVRLTVF